jgi:hypothetical protein
LHGRARSPARKLSNKQVAIIRTAANRRLTRYELAVLAGVGEDAIYNILNGSHYND